MGGVIIQSYPLWSLLASLAVLALVGVALAFMRYRTRKPSKENLSFPELSGAFAAGLAVVGFLILYPILSSVGSNANMSTVEQHYDVSNLKIIEDGNAGSGLGDILAGSASSDHAVYFTDGANLMKGDLVIDGNRATLYVGSDSKRTEYNHGIALDSGSSGSEFNRGGTTGHDRSADGGNKQGSDAGAQSESKRSR